MMKAFFYIFCTIAFLVLISFFSKNYFLAKRQIASQTSHSQKQDLERQLILGEAQFISEKQATSDLNLHVKRQWALKNISFLKAISLLKIKKQIKPVVVAVIDTGIHKKHPCLKNQMWVNKNEIPNNGIDDDNNGFVDDIHGWNFVNNNNNIQDYHGHGTHIAGIIAAQGRTNSSQNCRVIGVAPHVRIMTLKYFSPEVQNNNIQNTVEAIDYAIKNHADIINYSGGGPGENNSEKVAIAKAADQGIIFIAALGNDGSKISQNKPKTQKTLLSQSKDQNKIRQVAQSSMLLFTKNFKYYPASYDLPNIISIQSQNQDNEIIDSSNRIEIQYLQNKKVQTAPGDSIYSTLPPKNYIQTHLMSKILRNLATSIRYHNNYGFMTGTSQATAMATGVAALVKSTYPSWSMEKIINQVEKTGFGSQTDKIRNVTHQGKKLDAYEALIMKDSMSFFDQPLLRSEHLDTSFYTNKKSQHNQKSYSQSASLNILKNVQHLIQKKSKK